MGDISYKLVVVVRDDLTPGQKLAQSLHAGLDLSLQHPEITREWHQKSNTVVVLQAPLDRIFRLASKLSVMNVPFRFFEEPDRETGDRYTALAWCATAETQRFAAGLALAG